MDTKKIIFLVLAVIVVAGIFYLFKRAPEKEVSMVEGKVVLISTSMGNIKVELDPDKAPISCKNFLNYVKGGFYDGTIFHRVIFNFMVQGGGFTQDFSFKKTYDPIKNEAKNELKNLRGTLAMARTNEIDSATSQFFINHKDNDFLNHKDDANFGYAVFAKVIEGMDVVDKIAQVKTGTKMVKDEKSGIEVPFADVPEENVVITSVKVLE